MKLLFWLGDGLAA